MKYVGLQTQIWRNNTKSVILLLAFPALILGLTWIFFFLISQGSPDDLGAANDAFLHTFPWVTLAVFIWFTIAWFMHASMIANATASKPLERTENKRVYNLVENLCISRGMKMPKVYVIEDSSLNAFASGLNEKTFTVTLSRGIIDKLNDEELKGVIAHELTHIRNRDVRLMIVSIIFVGIFAFISEMAFRSLLYGRYGRRSKNDKGDGRIILLIMVLAIIGYFLSIIFRLAISRKREYMADAGSAEMTHNPRALASALRKIAQDPLIEAVHRNDVAQLFIEHPQKEDKGFRAMFAGLFATHPPIEKRIQLLEQF